MHNKYIAIVISLCGVLIYGCDSGATADSPLPAAGHARYVLNGAFITSPDIWISIDTNAAMYTTTDIQIATDDHILSMGFFTDDTTDENEWLFSYGVLRRPDGIAYAVGQSEEKYFKITGDNVNTRELSATFEFPNMVLRGGAFQDIPYDFEPPLWSNVSMQYLNKPSFMLVEPYQEVYAQQNERTGIWRVSLRMAYNAQLDFIFRPGQQIEGRYILADTLSLHSAKTTYTQEAGPMEKRWRFATTDVSNSFLDITGFDPIRRRIKGTFSVQMPSMNSSDTLTIEGTFEKCKVKYNFED